MLRKLTTILQKDLTLRGTSSEKISTFFVFISLQIKSRIFRKKNKQVKTSFYNYKFGGYDYSTISYLFSEVFIASEYYFQSATAEPLIIDCGSNIGMSILIFQKNISKH
jgi:hypothetical protein